MRILLTGIASMMFLCATAQSPNDCIDKAHKVLDEAFTFMQKHYYKKDSVHWDELVTSARSRINNSNDCEAAHEALQWCFKQMKEKHSFIMPAVKADVYNGNINSSAPEAFSQLIGPLRSEMIETGIAYIEVPRVSTADAAICAAFADSLQKIIADLHKQGATKWIIDLRNNTGGNCWPMLAGLGPLLGDGVLGYFVSSKEKIAFSYNNGTAMQGRHARCTVTYPYVVTGDKSIAILTSPSTASAGEIVALAFKGMPRVHYFGEPTAGLTTANATYKLSDGSLLVLTVCKEADRFGTIYEGRLIPNKYVSPGTDPSRDPVKSSAIMFLQVD